MYSLITISLFVAILVIQKAMAEYCPPDRNGDRGYLNVGLPGPDGCFSLSGKCVDFSGQTQLCPGIPLSVSAGGIIDLNAFGRTCPVTGLTTLSLSQSPLQICVEATGSIDCLGGGQRVCIPAVPV